MAVESQVVANLFVYHSTINLTSSMSEPHPSFAIPVQSTCTGEQFTSCIVTCAHLVVVVTQFM